MEEIRTLVVVRELANGDVLVLPAADPKLAAYGDEEEALLEVRMFLADHFARAEPETVARFALPEGTSLHETDVLVPREDLPRRVTMSAPVRVPSVVLPDRTNAKGERDRWVLILPMAHMFFVPAGEDLDEAIAAEVKRLAVAQELTPEQYLRLLPQRGDRLEPIGVELSRGQDGPAGRAESLRKRVAEHEAKKEAAKVLESVAQPLHLDPDAPAPRPHAERSAELALLGSLLSAEERASVVIVGPERAGKSGLLRAWLATEHAAGRTRYAYATSGAQLIAGMSGLGQWQERVRRVMEAAHRLDAILYFDDLSDLFAERPSGSVDIPSAMKPYMEDGRVRVVGELRSDALPRLEAAHAGFFGSMSRVRVDALDAAKTKKILAELIDHDARVAPDRPRIAREAMETLVDLSERYEPYAAFPGKAVQLYDELRASQELLLGSRAGDEPVGTAEVLDWFSVRTGVPVFLLRDDRSLLLSEVVDKLRARVVGQDEAVRRVAELVCLVKAGLQPQGKPLATLLFVGPTGVGKTELARALAELTFGSPDRLVRFDMSEYADGFAAARLFRGTERGEGLLTRLVREQPFCIVLLDEIEKAHPAVFDLLLQVCGEGRLTDGRGKTAFFHNAIVIMTSNLGATHRRGSVGFEGADGSDAAHYTKAVEQTFRPEMVNRIDRIVAFRSLSREELRRVARTAVARAADRRGASDRGVSIEATDAVLDRLAETAASSVYGARGLRREVERGLVTPVARLLARGGAAMDDARVIAAPESAERLAGEELGETSEGVRFGVVKRSSKETKHATIAMNRISAMRRAAHAQLRLERIVQLRDHVAFLVAQLGYGNDRKKKKRKNESTWSPELAAMGEEHHRLGALTTALEGAFDDLCSIEELALDAFFAREALEGVEADAQATVARFRGTLVRALVAQEPRRDTGAFMLQELDDQRGLELWLLPLLADAERRKWTLDLHVDGDREPSASWPANRRWGPPRSAEWMRERLVRDDRAFRNVLLRVRGDYAGIWLALESGLHRFVGFGPGEPAHLFVKRLSRRSELTDREWTPPALDPAPPTASAELRRRTPVRAHLAREGCVHLGEAPVKIELSNEEYWPRFEEIALAHLLLFETGGLDRDAALAPMLEESFVEVLDLVKRGMMINAIKLYRELTGVGLKEAKDAVETMR